MIPALRPLMALLLAAGGTLAHAADGAIDDIPTAHTVSVDVFGAGAMPPAPTGAERDGVAGQTVPHGVRQDGPAVLAALDFIRAGGWSVVISSARPDRILIDNGLAAVPTHAGYSRAFGAVDLDAALSYYSLDVGMRRNLGHAMSVMVHAGNGGVAGSGFDLRDLKAGLSRKLDGGWLLALNYTRAYGAAGSYDRMATAGTRADDRPAFLSAGRRALVLSAARRF